MFINKGVDHNTRKVCYRRRMNSATRVSLHYASLFSITGVTLPYAALWLSSVGMSGAEIGLLLSLPMLGRLVTGPLLAVWADGFRRRRSAIGLLAMAMAIGYGGAGLVESTLLRGLFWFVGATATAAIFPLGDVLALRLAQRDNYPFSIPRGFGSLAFVLGNVVMGALLTKTDPSIIILWIVGFSVLSGLIAWLLLPQIPVSEEGIKAKGVSRFEGLGRLIRNRPFMIAVLGFAAIQAAHGFYYGFSTLLWKAQGIAESTTGLLWGCAVAAEIGFMWLIDPWRRRKGIGAYPLLLIGGGAAILRWTLMATQPALVLLWPLQLLHALTFAATYLASVEIVGALSPRRDHTASQTLASMLSSGLLTGLATALSGPLYDHIGALGYLAMAAVAGAGLLAALSVRRTVVSALVTGAAKG